MGEDKSPQGIQRQVNALQNGPKPKPGSHPEEYPNDARLPPDKRLEGTAPTAPPSRGPRRPAGRPR